MKTYFGTGDRLHLIAPNGGVKDGQPFRKGQALGVVGVDAAIGEEFSLLTQGEYYHDVAKTANTAYEVGTPVYITAANALTMAAGGNSYFGYLTAPIASAAGASVRALVCHGVGYPPAA